MTTKSQILERYLKVPRVYNHFMSSKGDEVMKKLKNLEKGKGLSELVDALKKVDIKSVNTRVKLNEVSMEDGEGRRIYYFLTDEEIRKQNIGKNDFNPNEDKIRTDGVLKRFLNVLYTVSLLAGVLVGYLALISNQSLFAWLATYYLSVEVLRRVFLYVFYGQKFIKLPLIKYGKRKN